MLKLILILFFLLSNSPIFTQNSFKVTLINNSILERFDEVVAISLISLKESNGKFNFNSFIIVENDNKIPYEIINEKNELLLHLSFQPNEEKTLIISESEEKSTSIEKRTQSYLGIKTEYEKIDGYYTGGKFESIDFVKVPVGHFAHNALFQYEGPGWESEKVGYRLYLDARNRTDIFGKRTNELVVNFIGENDLVSDGKESYQSLQDWGMDIFKVGTSLGIGAIATFINRKVVTVSEVDSIYCKLFNNKLKSGFQTKHFGWNTGNTKTDITSEYFINAGSRTTKVDVQTSENLEILVSGLAKNDKAEYFSGENGNIGYIALYGNQTTINDNLGVVLFYYKNNLIEISEDEVSYFVKLNSGDNGLTYYFSAAWEKELNGITSKEEFLSYINEELEKLNNKIEIIFD